MHLLRLIFSACLLAVATCFHAAAAIPQGTVADRPAELDSLLTRMARAIRHTRAVPQEKVYLHFDNTGYYMGEKIRFKAYVVRADDRTPTPLSRVLHVELLNPGGDIVQRRKLKVDGQGQAHGDFALDSIYATGFYEVRAFTRYMANWGTEACFSRVFPVFRKPRAEGRYVPELDERSYRHRLPDTRQEDTLHTGGLHVAFYPEGGDLVEGLPARVAFLVSDGEGAHPAGKATVVDGTGRTVCEAVPDSMGRGLFSLPEARGEMVLRLPGRRGRAREFPLPVPRKEGCALAAELEREDSLAFTLRATNAHRGRLLAYALMNYGRVCACDTFTIGERGMRKAFPRERLPKGVSQFTVFDPDGRILCERLFFIPPKPDPGEAIRIDPPETALTPCGKVRVGLRATPGARFSFAAMDRATLCHGKEGQVKTWMLLASEVRGYIHRPEYYFEADDREHRRAADLLMMTQGWRRYDWRRISATDPEEGFTQPVEDTLYIFGKLKATAKGLPVGGIPLKAFLYNAKGHHLDGKTVTAPDGTYAFALPDLCGEWNLQLKAEVEKRKNRYVIGVDRHFSPGARSLSPEECRQLPLPRPNFARPTAATAEDDDTTEVLPLSEKLHKLPTVDVKAKRRFTDGARAAWQSEKRGQFWADIFYDCDEEADKILDRGEEVPALLEWLEKRNPFVRTFTTLNLEMDRDATYKGLNIVWILNNEYYWCALDNLIDTLANSSVKRSLEPFPTFLDEVKSMYITEKPSAYRPFRLYTPFTKDVVTIFLYSHWNTPQRKMSKGVRRTRFQGYNVPSTFEMEDYSLIPPMEDFRRTVYWNPDVTADREGKATVEFYNNSSCRELYLSAEGITTDGRCIFNE